ncbi:hypothetical protein ACO2Q8_18580 [Larkinella sp. VNQ87]|uniref:hypothetical protein n=1 Tax=Larkinella sp. VNQ87 TaxID=3400921 RepID=UPI003C104AA6
MDPRYWEFDSSKVVFFTNRSVKAVRGKNKTNYQIFLKDQPFTDGTIEFDVELIGMGFPGINFRMSADRKNSENFYIRSFGPVSPEERSTLQYAPIVNGLSMWDLADEYQTGAIIYQEGWNHVKLVVSGRQMKVYVNDMKAPVLHIPHLEANTNTGTISLTGNVIYANFKIDPARPEGLPAESGFNPVAADTRYLRNWQVHGVIDFPFGKDLVFPLPSMYGTLTKSDIPDSTAQWVTIQADRKAMVNLSARYAGVEKDGRRLAWLKTTIDSDRVQQKTLNLGFSDEVWLFVNGQIVYVDKNYFGTPNAKQKGRCTIENATVSVPLKQGRNELLVGLANYFYGWGLIARFADLDGIRLAR